MGKHILVIDDNEDIRKSFVLALKNTEYQVDTARSGEEGIEKERIKGYDLIFLDLKMPVMNGTEVLRQIRKTNKETPIYIITAFYKEFFDELKIARQEGIEYELLRKPIGRNEILLVVKSVLGSLNA